MQLRPSQDLWGLEQTGGRLRVHLPHLVSRFRGTPGRGLFHWMGVSVLRTLLIQVLLDALQDRDPDVVHRLRVAPCRGGALGFPVSPADGLGELDPLVG